MCENINQAGTEWQLNFSKHASKGTAGGRLPGTGSPGSPGAHTVDAKDRVALHSQGCGWRAAGGQLSRAHVRHSPAAPDAPRGHTPTSSRHLRTTHAAAASGRKGSPERAGCVVPPHSTGPRAEQWPGPQEYNRRDR